MSDARGLVGRRGLLTGATGGIGQALALSLAEAGMSLVLVGRHAESLDDLRRRCARHDVDVRAFVADVTDPDRMRSVAEGMGHVDLLVNGVGSVERDELPFWEADWDRWWLTYETNVRSVVHATRAVLPAMIEEGRGRVVNLNSIFALQYDQRYSAYSSSKLATLCFSRVLGALLAKHGVLMFDVSPGMVLTPMTAGMSICDGRTDWTDVRRICQAVVRIAKGDFDALSGRFLHAGIDDLDELLGRFGGSAPPTARTLGLVPYGDNDPIADR